MGHLSKEHDSFNFIIMTNMVTFKVKLHIHTIKDIGLDLCSGVAEFVESIGSFVCQSSVLNGSNNSNKHIILKMNYGSEATEGSCFQHIK